MGIEASFGRRENAEDAPQDEPSEAAAESQGPQSFEDLGIEPGYTAKTDKETLEFLSPLTDEERTQAEKEHKVSLGEGGAFNVRITAKDGSRPVRSGVLSFQRFAQRFNNPEKQRVTIIPPDAKSNAPEITAESEETVNPEAPKTRYTEQEAAQPSSETMVDEATTIETAPAPEQPDFRGPGFFDDPLDQVTTAGDAKAAAWIAVWAAKGLGTVARGLGRFIRLLKGK